MREIKFRAWVYEFEKMVDVKGIDFIGEEIEIFEDEIYGDINIGFNYIEFMQYTGLKDKNGVEIYEGDILGENPSGEVVFSKGEFLLAVGDKENYVEYNLNAIRKRNAIIGNIYKNTELLEVK